MEKPEHSPSFTVSTGIFSLTRDVFRYIKSNDLTETIGCMIAEGVKIQAVSAEDWQDALYPWDLIRMNERLLCGIVPEKNGTIHKSAIIQGAVRHRERGDYRPLYGDHGTCRDWEGF